MIREVPSRLEIDKAMQQAVQKGLVRFVTNEDGEDYYEITRKGCRYVEAMPNRERMKQILEEKRKGENHE